MMLYKKVQNKMVSDINKHVELLGLLKINKSIWELRQYVHSYSIYI